jgi:uncharacterized protein with NRDE domain
MCLLVLAWMSHPRYRLVVAANRDELHERPAAALGWWNDDHKVLAGRDLEAGGTWMGVTPAGRFGVVTNFRDLDAPTLANAPSRGSLVPRFLTGKTSPAAYLRQLQATAASFSGFNLLVGDRRSLCYLANRGTDGPRELGPGVYGLGNHWLDSPWPKLLRARTGFEAALSRPEPDISDLFDMLTDRTPAADGGPTDAQLPAELERALSAPFVVHERYGTRCSTVLLADHDGRTLVLERRFDPAGRQTGASRFEFNADVSDE